MMTHAELRMSALGQKRTSRTSHTMSALPPDLKSHVVQYPRQPLRDIAVVRMLVWPAISGIALMIGFVFL
jgi:hypothetical protein